MHHEECVVFGFVEQVSKTNIAEEDIPSSCNEVKGRRSRLGLIWAVIEPRQEKTRE